SSSSWALSRRRLAGYSGRVSEAKWLLTLLWSWRRPERHRRPERCRTRLRTKWRSRRRTRNRRRERLLAWETLPGYLTGLYWLLRWDHRRLLTEGSLGLLTKG